MVAYILNFQHIGILDDHPRDSVARLSWFFLILAQSHLLFHIHSYIHTYIHTYILTYIHTYILTYIHTSFIPPT
jgi:hypothetical protein